MESSEKDQPARTPPEENSGGSAGARPLILDHAKDPAPDNHEPTSLIASASRELVVAEESLWERLARLKETEATGDTRLALRDVYVELAIHYKRYGGSAAAQRFLKNALEQSPNDPRLRYQLAQLQGFTQTNDFIVSYTDLLRGRPFDLKMALEFCYFLEIKGLHEAALNVLETELKKRLRLSSQPDSSEAVTISGFLDLLRAQIDAETQVRFQDYEKIFASSFPKEVIESVAFDYTPQKTIIGQELEEFEQNYGLGDEIQHYTKLLLFFVEHYLVPVSIAVSTIVLVGLAIARVDTEIVETVGDALCFLLVSFSAFGLIRSLRLQEAFRLRAYTRMASNVAFASLAIVLLNWLGPRVLRLQFFSTFTGKAMGFVLVLSLLWRTLLSMSAIRRALVGIRKDVLQALMRRSFRRQLANLVGGTAKWSLLLNWAFMLGVVSHASGLVALFAAAQTSFLALCWRWGYLEANAEKQKLRDQLVYVIVITFIALIALDVRSELALIEVVVGLSVDGILVLGVGTTFALQIGSIGRIPLFICGVCFGLLNFAPVLQRLGIGWLSIENFPLVPLLTRIIEAAFVIVLVVVVQKSRTLNIRREVHMQPKYQILGGQVGSLGDSASATNFTQIWQASASNIDLSNLSTELRDLRKKLAGVAEESGHLASLSDIEGAEQAARDGNGPLALERLKHAGAWFWESASKVRVGAATAAAKDALGL